jgi:hypothetical protein
MYEIRINKRVDSATKVRITTIKKFGKWFGLFGWLRLWFTLRKSRLKLEDQFRGIAADCSPRIIH